MTNCGVKWREKRRKKTQVMMSGRASLVELMTLRKRQRRQTAESMSLNKRCPGFKCSWMKAVIIRRDFLASHTR